MAASVSATRPPSVNVSLEVRVGGGRPTIYEVIDGGFLVGSVPGCDLRLPGTNLAPIICLVLRNGNGATLRKLAPVQSVAVNGKSVASAYLNDGDQINIGPAELLVSIEGVQQTALPHPAASGEVVERMRNLQLRDRELKDKEQQLESERAACQRRREEVEAEALRLTQRIEQSAARQTQQERDILAARAELERREQLFRGGNDVIGRREKDLETRTEELVRQEAEVVALRRELSRIRTDLVQRYQQRRERLVAQQEGIRRAARLVQSRKKEIDHEEARVDALKQEWAMHQAEIEARGEQVQREKDMVEEQHRLLASRQQEQQRELARQLQEIRGRESALVQDREALEKSQKQHQADLVRLDRIQAGIEGKQKQFEGRALEVDRKFEQLQRDTRDLEEQATQMDEWHNRLTAETERLAKLQQEQEAASSQLEQRAAALEGQQTTLVTLRGRVERMREEMGRQEQALSDQRAMHEAREAQVREKLEQAKKLHDEVANDKAVIELERRRFDERRVMLDQAVGQLRQAREAIDGEQRELRQRQEQFDAAAAAQEQQAGLVLARSQQLEEMQERMQGDRQAVRDREAALSRAEQSLAALQEQVRKRSDEMNERQRKLDESERRLAGAQAEQQARIAQAEELQAQASAELEQMRQELLAQAAELEKRSETVAGREQSAHADTQRAEEARQSLGGQRQALATERIAWEVEKQAAQEKERQAREEFDRVRDQGEELARHLPELEIRATAALERLGRTREQLREHLTEVQTFAKQSRDDLEAARRQVQGEVERVRQNELDLGIARDEHRLAVAAFRQELIDWQGRIAEMKQAIRDGSSRLELRTAAVEDQARRLTVESERVQSERRLVAEKRGEMDRHLGDMREWYRRKLRELAGVDVPETEDRDPSRAVLSFGDEVSSADRHLGETLAALELVDADTLHALWAEARRQRRSLRDLLLNGSYLTLYQMSLIEAGNLDALVLGPVRVIERLNGSTAREAVYRVFDPRREAECVLRHLAESEMDDAVRPDEFRQRFSAAMAVQSPNVAGVLETLEIAGRPAALLESVRGLASGDWPGLAAAPGVWYLLVVQAAAALHAAHTAGIPHGHVEANSFVLAGDGVLKLVGLGEPRWLAASPGDESVSGDLLALGRVAAEWAALPPSGKGRGKPLPDELRAILERLTNADAGPRFETTLALLDELERAGGKVPASGAAWGRLLEKVREQVPEARRAAS